MISIKVGIFLRLLPFSALCQYQTKVVTRHPESHPCYRKLLMLHMGQKLAKAKTMDNLHDKSCSYC